MRPFPGRKLDLQRHGRWEMTMTKGKTWLALLLAGLVVTGAVLAASQAPVQRKADDTPEQKKPAPEQVRLDRHGDPLPPGAVARLGTLRFRAPDEANALAFAPDGKTIAVSSHRSLFLFAAD